MLLSIIIPVYNGEKYLKKCLDSVFSQTKKLKFEVIIIDDASRDNTPLIMAEYKRKYPDETRLFYNSENMGVSAVRNKGLKIACGAWISFVDADDILAEDFFELVSRGTDCDLILFDMLKFKKEKKLMGKKEKENIVLYGAFDRNMLVKNVLAEGKLLKGHTVNLASPWAKIYKRKFIERCKLEFLEEVKFGEDMLFNIQALGHQGKVRYVPQVVYYYRQHSGSAVHSYCENFIEEDKKFNKNLAEILEALDMPKDIMDFVYISALGGVITCLRRQIFAKEIQLSRKERYLMLDDIVRQEPYKTAVEQEGAVLNWKRRIIKFLLKKRWYWQLELLFYVFR